MNLLLKLLKHDPKHDNISCKKTEELTLSKLLTCKLILFDLEL